VNQQNILNEGSFKWSFYKTLLLAVVWFTSSVNICNAQPLSSPLFGGAGGTVFTDNVGNTAATQPLTSVSISSGWWIDNIQGISSAGTLAVHGGKGGRKATFVLSANEYIVRIYGTYSTSAYAGKISFATNKGTVFGPYGKGLGGTNSNTFDYTVPTGNAVVGFTGQSDKFLNKIGIIYNSIPTVSTSGNVIPTNESSIVKPPVTTTVPVSIGTNLEGFSYWDSQVPFKDLVIQSAVLGLKQLYTNDACVIQPKKDSEGYPISVPSGCDFRILSVFHIKNDLWPTGVNPYKAGHYVLLYSGVGTINLGWDATNVSYPKIGRIEFDVPKPNSGISVSITATDSANHIHGIHIVHANDEATYQAQPFNETFLGLLRPFNTIRFMDWSGVSLNHQVYQGAATINDQSTITLPSNASNVSGRGMVVIVNVNGQYPRVLVDSYDGITKTLRLHDPIPLSTDGQPVNVALYDFPNKSWSQRTKPNAQDQQSDSGVAYEYMIALANTLNADPWITIPTAANDDFVRRLALLIKNTLKPNLKAHIEYSNETWNYSYPGYHYSEAMQKALKLSGTVIPADAWHPYRAVQIFKIFNSVFGETDLTAFRRNSRIVRVLTSQTAWLDRAKAVMDWTMPNGALPTNGYKAYEYADAWAITTYFGVDQARILTESTAQLMQANVDSINDKFGAAANPGLYRKILAMAKQRNMQLVAYEGGLDIVPAANTVSKWGAFQHEPCMEAVYSTWLKNWDQLYNEFGPDAVGVMNQFTAIGRHSQHGYWGLMQSVYQDPLSSPRYQAVVNYAGLNTNSSIRSCSTIAR
jgi:Jacalin-like lectin domain